MWGALIAGALGALGNAIFGGGGGNKQPDMPNQKPTFQSNPLNVPTPPATSVSMPSPPPPRQSSPYDMPQMNRAIQSALQRYMGGQ